MALYIPHSTFHFARLLYVRPETFGPYYVSWDMSDFKQITNERCALLVLFS